MIGGDKVPFSKKNISGSKLNNKLDSIMSSFSSPSSILGYNVLASCGRKS